MPNNTQEEWDALIEHATDLAESDLYFQQSLYYFRAKQGLTTSDVADKLGMTPDDVTQIETGDPTLSDLRRYALVIGMDIVHTIKIRNKNDHKQSTNPYLAQHPSQ